MQCQDAFIFCNTIEVTRDPIFPPNWKLGAGMASTFSKSAKKRSQIEDLIYEFHGAEA